jgi:hypothetical protein
MFVSEVKPAEPMHVCGVQVAHDLVDMELRRKDGEVVATKLGLGRISGTLTMWIRDVSVQV